VNGAASSVTAAAVMAALLAGCRGAPPPERAAAAEARIVFEDVAEGGLRFRHHSGAAGKKRMPETMGSGCALFDVDNDGWLDALFVDGTAWPDDRGPAGQARLYRNRRDGTFEDVAAQYGLPSGLYGMGAAAGDYDNDGYTDLLLTALGQSRLLRNVGGRRFEDVTAKMGVRTPGWPTSAAWLDYDRDGRLDLFVCHYVRWTRETDRFFTLDGTTKSYARPDQYPGEACQLFRNDGTRFIDVSAEAGIANVNSKALGVALCDFDRDGWVDIAVSNDTSRTSSSTTRAGSRTAPGAASRTWRCRRGWPSPRRGWPGRGWASIPPTMRTAARRRS
jgi:enediyne biosynthesis protein E4